LSKLEHALPLCIAMAMAAMACTDERAGAVEHLRRGDAALAEGRYARALAAYNHARELAPADAEVQLALMRARAHVVADQPARITAEAAEEIRYELDVLLDKDKAHTAAYLTAQGNLLARLGDAEAAKAKLAEALKADPTSPLAHTALAMVLAGQKDGSSAAKGELEAALRAKPDHVSALVALAQIKQAEGDVAGAADRLEAALRVGEDFGARMMLGQVRSQQHKPAEAADQYQRAVQLDPRNPDALSAWGQALSNAGKLDEAERALRASSQFRPDGPTLVALGFVLTRQRKSAQALGIFTQILAQEDRHPSALFGAGVASEDLGQKDKAIDYYKRLLALPPPEGPQRNAVLEMSKDAQSRLSDLTAAPEGASSATPDAKPAPKKKP
jgi:cytochrome c-type biogenesis protein CcmH/NrfG